MGYAVMLLRRTCTLTFGVRLAVTCLAWLVTSHGLKAQPPRPTYPDPARKDYRDAASLTAADWVGPDGIVYPRWDRAGVVGGIPSASWPVVAWVRAEPPGRDITQELQEAVDEAGRVVRESNLPGGVVMLPPGTYQLSAPIIIQHDRVVIRGSGIGAPGPGTQVTRLMFTLQRPPEGKPWVHVVRYGGKVTQHSVFTVLADPRYRYHTPNHQVHPIHTIDRIGLRIVDEQGNVLGERQSGMPAGQGPRFYNGFVADQFPASLAGQTRVHVQAWVRYLDGEQVLGPIQKVEAVDFEREALPGVRRSNRYVRSAADAVFIFAGDQWTHRNNDQFLARTAWRGDVILNFENDVSQEEHGGLQPGDMLRLEATNTAYLRQHTGGGHPRMQQVTIAAVDGHRVTLDQPLRITFPATEGEEQRVSYAKPRYPLEFVGLEDVVLQFPNRWDWFSVMDAQCVRNVWMRGVRVEDAGRHAAFLVGVKHGEIRDCAFIGAHWPRAGGASAYIGFAGCDDSLMENVVAVGHRHGPDNHGGTGNVVRNSTFSGSDLQWHNGYGVEHLIENVTVGDNAFGGSYQRALHTPETGNQIHSPPGPRNVIWNCDLFGPRGGVFLGGYQQGWIFAYNRIKTERGPAFVLRDRQTDHIIIGNTIIMEDLFAPVVLHGDPRGGPDHANLARHNRGNDFIGNTIYGSGNVIHDAGAADDVAHLTMRRSMGNVIHPPDHAAPRPDPARRPMASLFETQRQHPHGLAPDDPPLYDPDVAFRGEPDRLQQLGELVAQINFCRNEDRDATPDGWLVETGDTFGPRDGDFSYGWDQPVRARRANRAQDTSIPVLYDTSNEFGTSPARHWSIALLPGEYDVQIALGDARHPTWRDHDAGQPNATYDAVHDVLLNDVLLEDRDGHADNIDVYQARIVVEEITDHRLNIRPGPRANQLRILFVRIHRASNSAPQQGL
jgi:hypothetical protein